MLQKHTKHKGNRKRQQQKTEEKNQERKQKRFLGNKNLTERRGKWHANSKQ